MTPWRWAVVAVLVVFLAPPLVLPFFELVAFRPGLGPWSDGGRLLSLSWNTLLLVAGTLAIALPVGVAGAILLFRTDLPLRRGLQFLLVLFLFIPLPLLTSAWQAAMGTGGWLPVVLWQTAPNQPWTEGLSPAIFLHALVAIPWVVLLVGQGLCWVEGELEEEALLLVHPLRVLWLVTLPRCRATIIAAALWVALQTASEITVVYMMQVPTFAEQVHTQFTQGINPLAEVLVLVLPAVLLTWLAVALLVPRLEKDLPPLGSMLRPPRVLSLGRWRGPATLAIVLCSAFLAVVPLGSLIWKAGLSGAPLVWSSSFAWEKFITSFVIDGGKVGASVLSAALAGLFCAGIAMICSWVARESPRLRLALLLVAALAAVLPGPVIGLGLKAMIEMLLDLESGWNGLVVHWLQSHLLERSLHTGPSTAPVVWVLVVRFMPYALLLVWPVVRVIPQEFFDLVRVEGGKPIQEFTHVVWPLTYRAGLWTAVLVTALSLSEIAATVRVETPGIDVFAKLIFDRMHYGVQSDVAALCLVLLAWLLLAVPVIGLVYWLNRPERNTLPTADRSLPLAGR